jgi:hypothetical protein
LGFVLELSPYAAAWAARLDFLYTADPATRAVKTTRAQAAKNHPRPLLPTDEPGRISITTGLAFGLSELICVTTRTKLASSETSLYGGLGRFGTL